MNWFEVKAGSIAINRTNFSLVLMRAPLFNPRYGSWILFSLRGRKKGSQSFDSLELAVEQIRQSPYPSVPDDMIRFLSQVP